jgi:hypothetical protein
MFGDRSVNLFVDRIFVDHGAVCLKMTFSKKNLAIRGASMNPIDGWRDLIERWANEALSIREIWLIGSHRTRQLALVMSESTDETGDAVSEYILHADEWQRQLAEILGQEIRIELTLQGSTKHQRTLEKGQQLWARSVS